MENKNLEKIEPILKDVKKKFNKIYGSKLKKIILYGSYARGEATEGSDIDLMIILNKMRNPIAEREKFFKDIWELDLKYDSLISVLPIKESLYKTRRLPVILNAKKEGIEI